MEGVSEMLKIAKYLGWVYLSVCCFETSATPQPGDLNDIGAMEAYVDGVMNSSMRSNHVAGAVVSILRSDEVILAKGYGYSNVETRTAVDPATTMFRIGSVSKLFTYTALMQLHERGKLDLDADIQDYLGDLKIPDTFPEPILVKNLFTHTAGFEDRILGLFAKDEEKAISYEQLFSTELPERVRKPGLVSSYSNHSLGVAGLIIENISGMSWPEYIKVNILDPLGMYNTTAYQPVPERLASSISTGYRWVDGVFRPQPFTFVPLASAGTMSASALDMMRFMRAQFNGGIVDGNRILSESTLAQMHSPLYNSHDSLDPWLYGFHVGTSRGQTTIGHDGGTATFFTNFLLLPDKKLGLFVSTNSVGGGKVMGDVSIALLERYFPFEPQITPMTQPSNLESIVGSYGTYRHPFTTALKLVRALSEVRIMKFAQGRIKIVRAGSDPKFATEIEPMVFQIDDSNTKVVFDIDEFGQQRMFIGSTSSSFYKLGPLDTLQSHILLLVICMLFFLWVLIAWPIQRFTSNRQPTALEHQSRWVFWLLSVVTIFTILGIALNASQDLVFGMNSALAFFMNLAYLVLVLTVLAVALAVRLITDTGTEMGVRIFHILLGVVAVTMCWILSYWNFMGG
jgi:CubicO group peptidase (beta-lactamase class C family)